MVHSRIVGWPTGPGQLSRFASAAVIIVICVVASLWLPQQPAIAPIDALTGHSSVNGNAIHNGLCADGSSCQNDSVVQADTYSVTPSAVAEVENKQPVGSEQLTALLLVAVFWALLRLLFASAPPGRASGFAGTGLPAILHCHPRGSVATLFGVFRL